MEEIYDDLCNYEEVNVQEVRDENKALKVKIEEYAATLEKIQKDYDTLDKEFKILHRNYCSLLVTARSEVKRKTDIITQINIEKDMMMLEGIKSGKDIRRNVNQGVKPPGRMDYARASGSRYNKNKDNVKQRKDDTKHERHETPVLPPKDAVPDPGACNKSKSNNAGENVELSNNRKSSVNENIAQHKTEHNEPPKTSASSIKDRRKSMPAVRNPVAVFSSDEELERNYQAKDPRTYNLRSTNERRNVNKMPIDRHSNAASGTSSMDDRGYNNSESTLRDNYKGRVSRHHDSTTFRGRDKYDISLKYRKQYSPERGQKRQHQEHQDDYTRHERGRYQGRSMESPVDHTRHERGKYQGRSMESPDDYTRHERGRYQGRSMESPDDYTRHERGRYQGRLMESPESHKFYNRDQRRKSDHRSDYDRSSYGYEKNRPLHDSQYSSKYGSKDHDEPHTKRQRTESYGNPDAHSKEGKTHYHEREPMYAPEPTFSPHEYDMEYDMPRFSCQSPDFVHTDAALANPIKEIMATAATPLEDPRVTSKKYVIWKENGVETLSTAIGRTIYIKLVNKAAWDVKPADIPVALVRRPSQCSDALINEIYMDIDNPVTNLDLSMGSGEVRATDDEMNVIPRKPKEIQHDTQDFKISKQVPEDLLKQATNVEKVSVPNVAKYRVPKIGQNNKNTQINIDVPVIDVDENAPQHMNVYRKGAAENSFPKELLTKNWEYNDRAECANVNMKEFLPHNKNDSKIEGNKKSRSRDRGENQIQAILTKIAIVADDLELSDDNSDHMDSNKIVVSDKLQKNCDIRKARTDDSVNYVVNKTLTSSLNTEVERTVDTADLKDVADEEKTKESDTTKKQKTKKKKSKSKEISKDSKDTTAVAIHVPEKKPKSKKEKESKPKETKEKFSDLFGDSNSLMTPEDLGIPSYLPISEDAQDAVDMKINQIIDAAPLIDKDAIPSNTHTQNRGEAKRQETKVDDDVPKTVSQISDEVVEDKEVVNENKKKKPSKRSEEIIDPNQLPSPIVYEHLNPRTVLNDPNVVKTVIVSTGKQPEIAFENKIEVTKPAIDVKVNVNTKDVHPIPATKEFKSDILKALATSTPHKEFSPVNPLEADTAKTDVICDPRLSTAVAAITDAVQVVNQTEQNVLESNDAPDMRIFVKRRRKVVKRPLMT